MELSGIIIERINKEGPISFRDYMEMCLYHPDSGYYTSPRNPIGVNGDFYTSSSLSSVFGALIGRQMEEMWQILGRDAFTIVEYGAGTGMLCRDILSYLQGNEDLYARLRYCIIEKSPRMASIREEHLHEKVCRYDRIEEIPAVNGCILSNELLDNFSVHRVVMKDELMEVFVGYRDGFIEILRPAGPALKEYLSELRVALPRDFRAEINLQATGWIKEAAAGLNRGYVLTIDYGYESSELYKTCRSGGTLMCYRRHAVTDCLYEHIGEQDITAHVNFSALAHWGLKNGLTCCGYTDQCHFLLSLGFRDYLLETMAHEKDIATAARKASFLSHTLLMDMGSRFRVMAQRKNVGEETLSGFRMKSA